MNPRPCNELDARSMTSGRHPEIYGKVSCLADTALLEAISCGSRVLVKSLCQRRFAGRAGGDM